MIRNIAILAVCLVFVGSCIKKNAIKYDPLMVGTWVGTHDDGTCYWFKVTQEDIGELRSLKDSTDDKRVNGKVRYSLFELKMWIGSNKCKVKEWLTGDMKGVDSVLTRDYNSLQYQMFSVDYRMVLKLPSNFKHREVSFYRLRQ